MLRYKDLMFLIIICGLFGCSGRKQSYPKAVGLGLLSMNTQYPIPLYRSEKDQMPFDTLKFETSKAGSMIFISNIKLEPYQMSAGDSDKDGRNNVRQGLVRNPPELKFCVTEAGESYFRVITNQKTMETFVIKKAANSTYYIDIKSLDDDRSGVKYKPRWYLYETWERYLKRAKHIIKANVIIYDRPEGNVTFENKSGAFLGFVVTDVKGEWIKVDERGNQSGLSKATKKLEGWTQWRQADKMLIDVTERSYE